MNEQKKKRKIPWFWRRRVSCPECGKIYNEHDTTLDHIDRKNFTCIRCGFVLDWETFWNEHHEKVSWNCNEEMFNT